MPTPSAHVYPSLSDYMGLDLTPEVIAANMPEYVATVAIQPPVSSLQYSSNRFQKIHKVEWSQYVYVSKYFLVRLINLQRNRGQMKHAWFTFIVGE